MPVIIPLFLFVSLCILCSGSFEPYADNGGTIVGIAGRDYCLIAADTRLSEQYLIRSRQLSRIFTIDDGLLLSGSGCWSDVLSLSKELQREAQVYEFEHDKKLAIRPLSYLLSSQLYMKRFFPYFTFSMIGGIDRFGKGAVYRYDAVGSSEQVAAVCCGKGEHLIQPILDELTDMEEDSSLWEQSLDGENAFVSNSRVYNQKSLVSATPSAVTEVMDKVTMSSNDDFMKNVDDAHPQPKKKDGLYVELSADRATEVVLRAYRAAAEREISVGDGVEVWILRRANRMEELSKGVGKNTLFKVEKSIHALPQH